MKLDLAGDRVDVWLEEVARAVWECPKCGKRAPLYGRRRIGDPSPWARMDLPEPLSYLSESSAVQRDLLHGKSQPATVCSINHKSLFCSVLHKLSFVFSPDVPA